MVKLAVFVSGRGSNLKSVFSKIKANELNAEIKAVVSNKAECPALQFAAENSIPTYVISNSSENQSVDYNQLIIKFKEVDIDLIVLAGFLKKIPDNFLKAFENKIINIHPALLPSFGGKGMYGMNVHKAVYDSSAKVSGATVHFVSEVYDAGYIIAQHAVDISNVRSPQEIAEKVLKIEHELLPFVIDLFSKDKIKISNDRVVYKQE